MNVMGGPNTGQEGVYFIKVTEKDGVKTCETVDFDKELVKHQMWQDAVRAKQSEATIAVTKIGNVLVQNESNGVKFVTRKTRDFNSFSYHVTAIDGTCALTLHNPQTRSDRRVMLCRDDNGILVKEQDIDTVNVWNQVIEYLWEIQTDGKQEGEVTNAYHIRQDP